MFINGRIMDMKISLSNNFSRSNHNGHYMPFHLFSLFDKSVCEMAVNFISLCIELRVRGVLGKGWLLLLPLTVMCGV